MHDASELLALHSMTAHNVAGIVNRCKWITSEHPYTAHDVCAIRTAPTFVDSIAEMFSPLMAGVVAAVLTRPLASDPGRLAAALCALRVTRMTCVPSLLNALVPHLCRRTAGGWFGWGLMASWVVQQQTLCW
jgi:non-ribosomal peptide synthetase component F